MPSRPNIGAEFRRRVTNREMVLGTFIKTPTGHATEILGDVGFDFVVIDEEHAPFDRGSIDQTLLAARAAGIAALVRVADPTAAKLLACLDDGASGVLVPHVSSRTIAEGVAAACRYRGGNRGFSNSPRAGAYGGLGMWDHVDAQDASVTVIAMIEDPEALQDLDAIIGTDGIHGVFIGRGDLSVALCSAGVDSDETMEATRRIIDAAGRARKPVIVMAADSSDAARLAKLGCSGFIISSDQGLMRQLAARTLKEFRDTAVSPAP